jgi:DNA repair protein SbcC/Rad50
MIIEEIEFSNFKSYGNKRQKLVFKREGELILLCGPNGSGKSTIKDVIDFVPFGKVSGRKKKYLPLKELPNRHNRYLFTSMKFLNENQDRVVMTRSLEPNKLTITINEEPYTDKYKKMDDKKREQIIGFNHQVFKSFISMSMKDFEDFIYLTESKKNDLLNKLFHLEELGEFKNIAQELLRQNQTSLTFVSERMLKLKEDIHSIQNILSATPEVDVTVRQKELKTKMSQEKPRFQQLKQEINTASDKLETLKQKLSQAVIIKNEQQQKVLKLEIKYENLEEKLKTYEQGECPLCGTNLKEQITHKIELEKNLTEEKSKLEQEKEIFNQMVIEETGLKHQKENQYNQLQQKKQALNDLKNQLLEWKTLYKSLAETPLVEVDKLRTNLESYKNKYLEHKQNQEKFQAKVKIYEELIQIFKGTEIKQNLIQRIITPVNFYLADFLPKLNSPYQVSLDENFDTQVAEIKEINPETLSKGQDRIINLAIAFAYLCSILDNKSCNLIFLDEVFDGIDVENTELIIQLLKEISMKYKINVIVVNHMMMNPKSFDRIIEVKQNVFSDLKEIKK